MHMLEVLFLIHILSSLVESFRTRLHVERHYLNDDGSLKGSFVIPNCYNGSVINFIAYRYQQQRCNILDDCHVDHEEPLSSAAEFLLHKMCSGKTKCDNLGFPMRSLEQKRRTNSIYLEYSCLGRAHTFTNMCEKKVTYFNDTAYVTYDNSAELFDECQCWVFDGNFSLTVHDLRLTTHGDQCSSATLFINNNKFACDSQKEDFGSVFHRRIIYSARNAFISETLSSKSLISDMTLFSLTPEVSARISCEGIVPLSPSTQMTKQHVSPQNSYSNRSESQRQSIKNFAQQTFTESYSTSIRTDSTDHRGLQIGIGIATPVVIIAIIGMVVFACRKYTGLRQSWYTRFHSWFGQTRNVFAVTCCCDKESETNERSVNRRERSERYPMKANCKMSAEIEVMIKNAGAENGKIQSPPNKETETGFISLNPGAATTSVPDQTDSTLCASESISTKNPLLPVPDLHFGNINVSTV